MLETNSSYVDEFMGKHKFAINKMSNTTYDHSGVALSAFKSIVKSALDNAYISYTAKNKEPDRLDSYLYGALKITNTKLVNENRESVLVCPGCKENGNIEILHFTSEGLCCPNCSKEMNNHNLEIDKLFYSAFANHSTAGYRCPECLKFIPDMSTERLRCPYRGCNFEGAKDVLHKMHHPTVKIKRMPGSSNLEWVPDTTAPEVTRLSAQEEIDIAYKTINDCIDTQIKTLHFKGFPATYVNKLCMYKAFKSSLDKYPEEIIPYLSRIGRTASGSKIQSKIFQEFVGHLEKSIPFSYTQKGQKHCVESLLDEKLRIFNGESTFIAEVNEHFEIPNLTQEIYVGGRSGYYCQPYYIGKLLEVRDIITNEDLLSKVREYSCIKIYMDSLTTKPGIKVQVKHLRIPAHYQMGGFVYVNRLKKILTEKVQIKLKEMK